LEIQVGQVLSLASSQRKRATNDLFKEIRLPELENPSLSSPREPGSVFLESLRERLKTIHAHLKAVSDEHKEKIRATAEAGRYKAGEQAIAPGDIVWLQYRNREHARRLMKAGGQPWKHPYRVEGKLARMACRT